MNRMPPAGVSLAVALLLTASLIPSCLPPGRKLLNLEVHLDGNLVLTTTFDVPDSEPVPEHWNHATSPPFSTKPGTASPLPAKGEAPLQAKLSGAVELKLYHSERVLSSASLTDLELIRTSPDKQDWHLPPGELRRVQEATAP